MRRFTHRGRSRRTSFRRRRSNVVWLPTPKTALAGVGLTADSSVYFAPIEFTTNQFVGESNNSRFAVQSDEITYQRILGNVRIGMYFGTGEIGAYTDSLVTYGIALVKGEYDDTGTWTSVQATLPDPRAFADDPDKWMFRNDIILGPQGAASYLGPLPTVVQTMRLRPGIMCTDEQLPNGSWVDIKPRRKARYEEKLGIIYAIDRGSGVTSPAWDFFLNYNIRVLTTRWG